MNFGIIGAMGRMGQTIARLSVGLEKINLKAAIESEGSSYLEKNYGSLIGFTEQNKFVFPLTTLDKIDEIDLDGLIDFSSPDSTLKVLEKAKEKKIPVVIGTTGFQANEIKKIEDFSKYIPVLFSSNMSLGVNLLFWLVQKASNILKNYEFDSEIMEIHHNQKKDAPSGTSVTLENIILNEFSWAKESVKHGRSGLVGKRPKKELGSFALRGGDVVGEHTVYFMGEGERIELTHRANNRNIFASGALHALIFVASQEPALYTMRDVLGLD